ncbi:SAM-dependent methyltransferase [Streptosporangium canum]|uniref:SAM-dependent methyltransferase n=1 Tax=Streptosporangium canum TaxID=324952 RepID=UPI0036B6BA95
MSELPHLDVSRPATSRVYAGLADGKDLFATDRKIVEAVKTVIPGIRHAVRANCVFLREAVATLTRDHGITQVLDLGAGLPDADTNLHDVAREHAPHARIVYVDHDPMVVAHWRARLNHAGTAVVHGDALFPAQIMATAEVKELIDFTQPVALVMGALMHFWTDDVLPGVLGSYLAALKPGSALAFSHATTDKLSAETAAAAVKAYGMPIYPRSGTQIRSLLSGLKPLPPGVVAVRDWPVNDKLDRGSPPMLLGGVAFTW